MDLYPSPTPQPIEVVVVTPRPDPYGFQPVERQQATDPMWIAPWLVLALLVGVLIGRRRATATDAGRR